ncbi:MAG: hypothetical protein ABII12_11515, partial [Planctomycetota bacterium]
LTSGQRPDFLHQLREFALECVLVHQAPPSLSIVVPGLGSPLSSQLLALSQQRCGVMGQRPCLGVSNVSPRGRLC